MIFGNISSIKYQISFDESFDDLQVQGVLDGDEWLQSLTDNEVINNHWKKIGCPKASFNLEILREEHIDGSTSEYISSSLKATLTFIQNGVSQGNGTMKLHPSAFDKLLAQVRSNHNQMRLLLIGKGASYIESQKDYFKCKIEFRVLKTIIDLK